MPKPPITPGQAEGDQPKEIASGDLSNLRNEIADLQADLKKLSELAHEEAPKGAPLVSHEKSGLVPQGRTKGLLKALGKDLDIDEPDVKTRSPYGAAAIPRDLPDAVIQDLGEKSSSIPDAAEEVITPAKRISQLSPRDLSNKALSEEQLRKRDAAVQSKRNKKDQRRAERRERVEKRRDGDDGLASLGVLGKSLDDIDIESAIPEPAYTPSKTHTDLVLDRRKRRQAAEEKAARGEEDQPWDEVQVGASKDQAFNLAVYILKAVLITGAGALLISGARTAWTSMRAAQKKIELLAQSDTPSLQAIGLREAQGTLERFLKAPTWEAKLQEVRKPEQAKSRMQQYYKTHPELDKPLELKRIFDQSYSPLRGGEGHSFGCEFTDENVLWVPVVRFPNETNQFVVDWEAMVQWSDADWVQFLEERNPETGGTYRVYAIADNFYSGAYEDSDRYLCLRLWDPKREKSAYAYVERHTEDEKQIRIMLAKRQIAVGKDPRENQLKTKAERDAENWLPQDDAEFAPMVIEVRFPKTAKNQKFVPQLDVARFLSPNWIVAGVEP